MGTPTQVSSDCVLRRSDFCGIVSLCLPRVVCLTSRSGRAAELPRVVRVGGGKDWQCIPEARKNELPVRVSQPREGGRSSSMRPWILAYFLILRDSSCCTTVTRVPLRSNIDEARRNEWVDFLPCKNMRCVGTEPHLNRHLSVC